MEMYRERRGMARHASRINLHTTIIVRVAGPKPAVDNQIRRTSCINGICASSQRVKTWDNMDHLLFVLQMNNETIIDTIIGGGPADPRGKRRRCRVVIESAGVTAIFP